MFQVHPRPPQILSKWERDRELHWKTPVWPRSWHSINDDGSEWKLHNLIDNLEVNQELAKVPWCNIFDHHEEHLQYIDPPKWMQSSPNSLRQHDPESARNHDWSSTDIRQNQRLLFWLQRKPRSSKDSRKDQVIRKDRIVQEIHRRNRSWCHWI